MTGIPARWVAARNAAGYTSFRKLAEAAGNMSPQTVLDIARGASNPQPANRARLAKALRMTPEQFHQLLTGTDEQIVPYDPPRGSERLSQRERRAITEVILTFLDNKEPKSEQGTNEKKTSDAGDARVGEKTPDLGSRVAFDLAASREPGVKRIDPRKGRKTQS